MAPSKYRRFKQGVFSPRNKQKFLNPENLAVYRSKLELRFMQICDTNSNILEWSSERVIIPYFNSLKQTTSRYFIDFYIKTADGRKFLVEVKPERQMKTAINGTKKTLNKNVKRSTILYESAMAQMNKDKWYAAKKWAEDHGMSFIIVTEKTLENL